MTVITYIWELGDFKLINGADKMELSIPKIIHMTWKSEELPEHFNEIREYWKTLNPEYEFRLWTDEDNRKLIEEEFPFFLEVYDSYKKHIQRVDAVRYCILYLYGGIYIDLDFLPIRPIDDFLDDCKLVLGKEPPFAAERREMDKIVSNAFMATTVHNEFFQNVIHEMIENHLNFNHLDEEEIVLNTTGPFMLTKMYDNWREKEEIRLLDSSYFFPLHVFEIEEMYLTEKLENAETKLSNTIAIHLFCGTWWKDSPIIYSPEKLYQIIASSKLSDENNIQQPSK